MAIHYSVVAMKNPQDPEAPVKYYARSQAAGVVDINELAEEISYATTLTDGDVLNAKGQRILTPLQHEAFIRYFGEPGE